MKKLLVAFCLMIGILNTWATELEVRFPFKTTVTVVRAYNDSTGAAEFAFPLETQLYSMTDDLKSKGLDIVRFEIRHIAISLKGLFILDTPMDVVVAFRERDNFSNNAFKTLAYKEDTKKLYWGDTLMNGGSLTELNNLITNDMKIAKEIRKLSTVVLFLCLRSGAPAAPVMTDPLDLLAPTPAFLFTNNNDVEITLDVKITVNQN